MISGIFLFFGWQNKKIRILNLIFIFIIFGIVRYNLSWPKVKPNKIQFYNNQKVEIQGIVIDIDRKINKTEIILKSEKLIPEERKVSGKVLVYAPLYIEYQYGDKLQISCYLYQPTQISGFAYHEYLAKRNIYSTCLPKKIKILEKGKGSFLKKIIFLVRNKIKTTIEKTLTEPEGSILSTILLGISREIPLEVRNWFALTGTAHLLSISGLHVAILSTILLYFAIDFLALARSKAFYFVILVLIFYILLVGLPAPAVRSAIMGISVLLAEKIGRRSYNLNLIIFTAALMLLFNPKLLKSDLGFQLSFSAILGITLLADYFFHIFNFLKLLSEKLQFIQNYLATTCSAYLFSLPLILFYFGNFSLIAPLANILVLPILPILMGLGFLYIFSAIIYFGLAQILAWPIWLILHYLVFLTKSLSFIPYFSFNFGKISFWFVLLFYLLLTLFVIKIQKNKNYQK